MHSIARSGNHDPISWPFVLSYEREREKEAEKNRVFRTRCTQSSIFFSGKVVTLMGKNCTSADAANECRNAAPAITIMHRTRLANGARDWRPRKKSRGIVRLSLSPRVLPRVRSLVRPLVLRTSPVISITMPASLGFLSSALNNAVPR